MVTLIEEANKKVEEFIIKSYHEGVKKLIIVTGKGFIQKREKSIPI